VASYFEGQSYIRSVHEYVWTKKVELSEPLKIIRNEELPDLCRSIKTVRILAILKGLEGMDVKISGQISNAYRI
jgi:hypothetical protein